MKYLVLATSILLAACGGTLSDEQRKRMKEQMELHKIRRVTETEITEAGFAKGRQVVTYFERNSAKTDVTGTVQFLRDSLQIKNEVQRQLFLAYWQSSVADAQDNLQKIRRPDGSESDSLLYTKPVFVKSGDREIFQGMWSVWLSRKQLILEMPKKK